VISNLKYKYNGQGFVYDRWRHLFVVGADGGEPRQLTAGEFHNSSPVWSPDGRSIAFVSARHPDRDHDDVSDVWLMRAEGGEPRRLTDSKGPVAEPSFSPDGQQVAYFHAPHVNAPGRNDRLYVIDAVGGTPRSLTDGLDRTCGAGLGRPRWSSRGAGPYFGAMDRGNVPVYAADGRKVVGGDRQVQGYDLASDGHVVFAAVDPVSPPELYVADLAGGGERQLTEFNRAWKAEVELSRPERLTFERDGFPVDVWVMRPAGYTPGRKYPVLLNVHGGPHAQYGHTFFDEFQVYAGAGFAVVYCNPRGSQGYGEAFSMGVVGDYGGGDYADVMAALDEALAAHDFLDADRLGIMGGSYGGFMTSWTVSHTNRFKAACSERALNTWRSFVGTSDIGYFFPEAESGGRAWDDVEWQMQHSPLTYAQRIETPLLIIHAEDDLRCPIEQAEELFVALKMQRKDVLFVRFPDEDHEMSRSGKPRHRLARFGYILDWFSRRL
jgi:dipeptidyl aminopeptidase/acylaminoacyl peptidase